MGLRRSVRAQLGARTPLRSRSAQYSNGVCQIVNGQPLFPVRTALVLAIAIMSGLVGGTIAYLAHAKLPEAALYAVGAAVAALLLAHQLIGPEKPDDTPEEKPVQKKSD